MSDSEFHEVVDALMRGPATPPSNRSEPVRNVVVFGAGPLGQLLACAALTAGAETRLCSVYGSELGAIRAAGAITVRGAALVGTYAVSDTPPESPAVQLVSGVDDAIRGADVIVVATSAAAQELYCGLLSSHLTDRQIVLLVPGRFLGAAAFTVGLARSGCHAEPVVAELAEPPYLVDGEPGALQVHAAAKVLNCAAIPAAAAEHVTNALHQVLPALRAQDNVLETAFAGTTALLRGTPALLNVGLADHTAEPRLLREVLTERIATSVLRQMDAERTEVAFRYGIRDLPTVEQQVGAAYGGEGTNLAEVLDSAAAFDEVTLRVDLAGEVRHVLVPLMSAAKALEVPTPTTSAMAGVASALLGIDLPRSGRTLPGLGLDNYRPDQLRKVLASRSLGPLQRQEA